MTKVYAPLDKLILDTGIKLTVIADRLGIDKSTLYKWRVAPNTISIDGLEKLATILNISFYELYEVVKKFKQEVA